MALLKEKRTKIQSIDESMIDTDITICGWVTSCHAHRNVAFAWIADDAASRLIPIQAVFDLKRRPDFAEIRGVTKGWSLGLKGKIVKSIGTQQAIEMQVSAYQIFGKVADPASYALAKDDYPLEYLRGLPHLECHSTVKSCIYSVRSALMTATERFFESKKFRKVDMPLITMSQCEGGANPAQVTDFLKTHKRSDIATRPILDATGKPTGDFTDDIDFSKDFSGCANYLTVSAQLELETQLPLGDVWTETRATRFEPSMSTKHLASFSMIEAEISFIESAVDLMDVTEEAIKYCTQYVLSVCEKELKYLGKYFDDADHIDKLCSWLSSPFTRITHAEAVTMMQAEPSGTFLAIPQYDEDLSSEHENWLTAKYDRPVFVARYPKKVKSFYMPVILETVEESYGVEHVDSYDLLVPNVGELVGGSRRIHDLAELETRITELDIDRTPLEFYIALRRDGTVPHGGWGWGHERFVKMLTGAPSVKDCVAFPFYVGCGK